jgi:hypothetical protein
VVARSGAIVLPPFSRIGPIAFGIAPVNATSTKISGSSLSAGWKNA